MLLKPTVWLDAANQVFYSFGLAFGSIISFGSYNNPEKNCVKDVIIISLCNGFTAIYACAVIFSILGFMANAKGVEIGDVVKSGPGLAFLVYPEVNNYLNNLMI